jgi:hypothetical protein
MLRLQCILFRLGLRSDLHQLHLDCVANLKGGEVINEFAIKKYCFLFPMCYILGVAKTWVKLGHEMFKMRK